MIVEILIIFALLLILATEFDLYLSNRLNVDPNKDYIKWEKEVD